MSNVTMGSLNIYNKVNLIDVMSKCPYNNGAPGASGALYSNAHLNQIFSSQH